MGNFAKNILNDDTEIEVFKFDIEVVKFDRAVRGCVRLPLLRVVVTITMKQEILRSRLVFT